MDNEQLYECLRILEKSISDVGYWSWWDSNFPDSFQLEFCGVQLWNPPLREGEPPSGTIALKFLRPVSVSFISRNLPEDLRDNWYELLHQDKLEPFAVNHNCFVINDKTGAEDLLKYLDEIKTIYGIPLEEQNLFNSEFFVCFWAGPVGAIVFAEKMEILSHRGKIELSEIPIISKKWWDYWREYWQKKGTKDELPKDYTCEVTIPAG
ncbi:MAG: hypothetical protein ABIL05_05580 [candidate division WOR-3 bacterium]